MNSNNLRLEYIYISPLVPRPELMTSANISEGGRLSPARLRCRLEERVALRLTLPGTEVTDTLSAGWSGNAGWAGMEYVQVPAR
jgi:hypothetical protein